MRFIPQGSDQLLPDLFLELKSERLGVEAHFLTFKKFKEVEEAFSKARPTAKIIATEDLVERLRIIKDDTEIEKIVKSIKLTEKALQAVWNALAPGKTEKEMAWLIEKTIRENGGQAVSFPPIVAAGPNAALPHAVPTDRRIDAGETVILDLGSKLDGYCSDMTRTWIFGAPDPKLKEIYKIVREAQLAAQDKIRAGVDSIAGRFGGSRPHRRCWIRRQIRPRAGTWSWTCGPRKAGPQKSGPHTARREYGRHGGTRNLPARIRRSAARKHGSGDKEPGASF